MMRYTYMLCEPSKDREWQKQLSGISYLLTGWEELIDELNCRFSALILRARKSPEVGNQNVTIDYTPEYLNAGFKFKQ
jgi:hypothetical protein